MPTCQPGRLHELIVGFDDDKTCTDSPLVQLVRVDVPDSKKGPRSAHVTARFTLSDGTELAALDQKLDQKDVSFV